MSLLGRALGVACFGLSLAACSSSSDGKAGASGANGDNAAGSAGAAPVAGGAGGSGPAAAGSAQAGSAQAGGAERGGADGSAGSAGAAESTKIGQVVFASYSQRPQASASFSDAASSDDQHCTVTDLDGCTVTLCDDTATTTGPVHPSAGTITLTSPDVTGSAVLKPASDGSYGAATASFDAHFLGQETISFKASGGSVPAFESTLTMPLALLRSDPYVDNSDLQTRLYVPRDRDLAFTWTRGTTGVYFIVTGGAGRADGKPGTAALYCAFASELGTGVVRSSLLQQLEAETLLNTVTALTKSITAGDYTVTLATAFDVFDATKTFPVTSTIQLHDL